jgi:hypothetical protein
MTIAGFTTTQWFWILAAHATELGLIWWLLRPRIAKELAGEDAFAIRYQTVDKYANLAQRNEEDHRVLTAQISSVAEHKAEIAVRPVAQRVEELDRRIGDVLLAVEKMGHGIDANLNRMREETTTEIRRLYDRIDAVA